MKLFSSIGAITKIPVAILVTGFLFSCVNDLNTIQQVNDDPNSPDEVTKNLYVHYTDSGYARVQIFAAIAETYNHPEKITKLKDQVKINFFSESGEIVSTLTSLYGEINHETGLMVVRDSVVLLNLEKKQWLETEELYYNERDSSIYTDKYVFIKKEGKPGALRGRGLQTTPFFNDIKGVIQYPEGPLYFGED
ncbi:MAG: LPS export ABC transporter periplasmic protein LptC [Crocinitomicaceae bacterium]|nr:LPS export ABC transporter periplasmic protein LptC [Crocinitomicaceae bacterium]